MKKTVSITAFVIITALGLLYLNQGLLIADDRDGKKDCSSECTQKKEVKTSGEFSSYEFVTDKACCDKMKTDLQTGLLSVAGVKEVNFGSTCNVSKMTSVTVLYAAGETTEDNIASFLKEQKIDCEGKSGCDKEGKTSGSESDCSKQCPSKSKTKDSKQL